MKNEACKVYAPASVANVAVGYDILGFAIEQPGDDVIVRTGKKEGLTVKAIHGDQGKLPKNIEDNTAAFSAFQLMKHLGYEKEAIEIEIFKKMPFASGLGSSAASAVAGAFAINEYFGRPLRKSELLPFTMMGEQIADGAWHADNVGPSLLGGIILIRNNDPVDFIKLPIPRGLCTCIIHPHILVKTSESRGILSDTVSLKQQIEQSGNLAAFVAGLYTSDFDLIGRSLRDCIIEPQRAQLIPHFYSMKEAALNLGALGFSISGAGPSVFALCNNTLVAENIAVELGKILSDKSIEHSVYLSPINPEGAFKY